MDRGSHGGKRSRESASAKRKYSCGKGEVSQEEAPRGEMGHRQPLKEQHRPGTGRSAMGYVSHREMTITTPM